MFPLRPGKQSLCVTLFEQQSVPSTNSLPSQVEVGPDGSIRGLKLADFGLAVEVWKPLHAVCGTPTYVAPEILLETGYGLKVSR